MLSFFSEVSRFKIDKARRRKLPINSWPLPLRIRLASSVNVTSSVQWRLFSTVQCVFAYCDTSFALGGKLLMKYVT